MPQIPTHVIRDRKFGPVRVEVDDTLFIRCAFTQSKIVFEGTGPVNFDGCTFDRCEWVFGGPAENTLLYLSALYHGLGEGGMQLVDSIFASVRQGGIEQGSLTMHPALR